MSFHGLSEMTERSACWTSDPSGSRRSSRFRAESTTSSRPSGRKSMHIGNDSTVATTSWPPPGSSAITLFAPQSENHRRPSCQRGDSPKTTPSIRTSGPLTAFSLGSGGTGIDRVPPRKSSVPREEPEAAHPARRPDHDHEDFFPNVNKASYTHAFFS